MKWYEFLYVHSFSDGFIFGVVNIEMKEETEDRLFLARKKYYYWEPND